MGKSQSRLFSVAGCPLCFSCSAWVLCFAQFRCLLRLKYGFAMPQHPFSLDVILKQKLFHCWLHQQCYCMVLAKQFEACCQTLLMLQILLCVLYLPLRSLSSSSLAFSLICRPRFVIVQRAVWLRLSSKASICASICSFAAVAPPASAKTPLLNLLCFKLPSNLHHYLGATVPPMANGWFNGRLQSSVLKRSDNRTTNKS